jgi:hypothetical protein
MITYHEIGANKRLNEITIAGSHDAGVREGAGNVQTQKYDIIRQAMEGVRVFDIRIAAQSHAAPGGGGRQATLKAFHSSITRNKTKSRFVTDVGRQMNVNRSRVVGGAFGESLSQMLDDARDFVQMFGKNEFLILKFDKCKNWSVIAEACIERLGNTIYNTPANVNTQTLDDLKGKVIVVFGPGGMRELHALPMTQWPNGRPWGEAGILGFRNLYSGGSYDASFHGIQYYGKGGTSVTKPFRKLRQNVKKQTKILDGSQSTHPDTLSMMYWTTTGIFESIRKRNDGMWDAPNVHRMKKLWASGLREHVEQRFVGHDTDGVPLLGMRRRLHMPNIVMIDFADQEKCRHIRELNDMTDQQIGELASE